MIKKTILGAVGGTLGLALLGMFFFGWDSASYVSTSVNRVKHSVRDNVPIGFDIDRARKMIAELTPDIRQNMHVIAEEEVELKQLDQRVEKAEAELARQRTSLMTMRNDLSSQREVFTYAGHTYTAAQVKIDLANRFDRYKTQDATLASLKQIRKARQQSLGAARQKLDGMVAAKRQLEVDVENLEAQMKLVEAAQTTADYNFADSRLSRVKELVSGLQTRIDVARKLVDAEDHYVGEIEMDSEAPADLDEQITNYFEGAKPQLAESKKVEENPVH